MARSLQLTGNDLTLENVYAVAHDESFTVSLAPEALTAVKASRQVIENILAENKIVYGVNTGFGAMSHVVIPPDQVDQLQVNLVLSHCAGTGSELSTPAVRAMMLLRANTLAKGFSGVRPMVIETLLEMLNKGVYPVVPSQGSLGASGDLAPLAHMSSVLIGHGDALYKNQRLSGSEALKQAGITPLTLKAKEGLALLNGTQMMTALGALTLIEAEKLADIADLAGAATIEAVMGSHKPFDERIYSVRPHAGHAESAKHIRKHLQNSQIEHAHENCAKVQDAYSLRCIPQVHGAARDAMIYARNVLSIEINAATDNPLVFPNGDVVSQGNFHGEPVAMALDMLGIALAELASISERRMDKLMNPAFSELPAFLVPPTEKAGLNSGFMIVHYAAAALVSENKALAHPAVVDSIPTSNDKEDHVSMGATAARKARKIYEHTRWVLASELLCAAQGLDYHGDLKPGDGIRKAHEKIRTVVPTLKTDRILKTDIEKICEILNDLL